MGARDWGPEEDVFGAGGVLGRHTKATGDVCRWRSGHRTDRSRAFRKMSWWRWRKKDMAERAQTIRKARQR
jgi:hypothetical protein